jgi:hypothetical protein
MQQQLKLFFVVLPVSHNPKVERLFICSLYYHAFERDYRRGLEW